MLDESQDQERINALSRRPSICDCNEADDFLSPLL